MRERKEDPAMNGQVEQDLRLALAVQAAELPSDASSHLLATDYRPRAALGRPCSRSRRSQSRWARSTRSL
jgi:hypothetical protein